MNKHTPGPWTIRPRSGFDYGTTVYDVPEVCTNISNEQNARLISAAPDLLEACKALEILFAPLARDSTTASWIDKARAAIAKAEGKA